MRFLKYNKRRILIVFIILIVSILVFFFLPQHKSNTQIGTIISPTQTPYTTAKVINVIDGDTIKIDTGQKVRYIGINTPEITYPEKPNDCYALEAKEKNKELVEGKTVKLKKDISETDKYGRLLRYIFIENSSSTSEAIFINKILITEGYARIMSIPPDLKYYPLFKEEQVKAKENKKGLWNQCL